MHLRISEPKKLPAQEIEVKIVPELTEHCGANRGNPGSVDSSRRFVSGRNQLAELIPELACFLERNDPRSCCANCLFENCASPLAAIILFKCAAGTRFWIATKGCALNIKNRFGTAHTEFVCSVDIARCPDDESLINASTLSSSRISPIITTSGAWLAAEL
jgi:hypothetical protein